MKKIPKKIQNLIDEWKIKWEIDQQELMLMLPKAEEDIKWDCNLSK